MYKCLATDQLSSASNMSPMVIKGEGRLFVFSTVIQNIYLNLLFNVFPLLNVKNLF